MINRQNAMYSCKISDINGKSSGATLFFTTEVANYRSLYLIIDLTSTSGFVSAPSITMGTNATAYNNILGTNLLSTLISAGNSILIPLSGTIADISGGTGIYLNVSGVATATTYTFNATLLGFYDLP